jgi:hypothetical protein
MHPAVALAAVTGVPDEVKEELTDADVIPKPGETVTTDALFADTASTSRTDPAGRPVGRRSIHTPRPPPHPTNTHPHGPARPLIPSLADDVAAAGPTAKTRQPGRSVDRVASMPDRPVRLAEIVAALSLGIDLGFSQPMEHVLRQCLIALRVADQVGLDDEARAAVYYSALLVNVGCHSDAHEQARWFGDDIALKATKFDFEPRSAREALAMVRLLGAGGSPLHPDPHRRRVRRVGTPRRRRHARPARGAGPATGRATGSAGRGRRRVGVFVRAVGRQGLAREDRG